MVADHVRNAHLYYGMGPRIELALRALQGDLPQRPPGRYQLQGDTVYADVQSYVTMPAEQCKWEAHRKYIDLQFVSEGIERIAFSPLGEMTEKIPYDPARDVAIYSGEGSA